MFICYKAYVGTVCTKITTAATNYMQGQEMEGWKVMQCSRQVNTCDVGGSYFTARQYHGILWVTGWQTDF